MKRTWDIEELIEHFTLVPSELLGNKTGATRLGFALLLKCFQLEGRFPTAKHEIPRSVVDYVAHQLKVDAVLFTEYDWEGRTITNHRTQIREHFEFRDATSAVAEEVTNWLVSTGQAAVPHIAIPRPNWLTIHLSEKLSCFTIFISFFEMAFPISIYASIDFIQHCPEAQNSTLWALSLFSSFSHPGRTP